MDGVGVGKDFAGAAESSESNSEEFRSICWSMAVRQHPNVAEWLAQARSGKPRVSDFPVDAFAISMELVVSAMFALALRSELDHLVLEAAKARETP